jgi:hypothetical protein
MAKKRLNQYHRRTLITFAEENVKCEEEHMAMIASYNAACIAVRSVVEAKYPPSDMKLLDKYSVARNDQCIKGARVDNGSSDVVIGFEFITEEEAPLVPCTGSCKSRVYPYDADTAELVLEYARNKLIFEKAVETKKQAYRALIWDSRYFEDILEVWPAAEALRERIGAPETALTRLSPELADFIRTDNAGALAA